MNIDKNSKQNYSKLNSHDYVGFISVMQDWFSIRKLVNLLY